jgi:hypothetical protein
MPLFGEVIESLGRYLEHETRVEATALAQERLYRYALERAVRMSAYAAAWQREWNRASSRDAASGRWKVTNFRRDSA